MTGCFDGACVFQTASDALKYGYNVTIDRDMNIIDNMAYAGKTGTAEEWRASYKTKWEALKAEYPTLKEVERLEESYCSVGP